MLLKDYSTDELLVRKQEAEEVLVLRASSLRPVHINSLRDGLALIIRALAERGVE
jgi:hypothetical protein